MKTDQGLLAFLLALTAGPLIEGYTMLMKHFGFTTITALETLSLMWQREPSQLLGTLGIFGVVTWVFLLFYYSANFWGTDYFPIKGMLLAMTGESLVFNIFGVLSGNEILVQNVSGNYVHASSSAIAGLWVGFIYQKYLFQKGRGNNLKTDQTLPAILIGFAGWPLAEGFTQLMKYFGLTTLSSLEAVSLMWLREPSLLLGLLGVFGIGCWIGLFIYYSVNFWGTDYFPIKAALILLAGASLLFHIFGVLGRNELLIQNVSGSFVHAAAAVMAGAFIGFLMKRLLFQRQAH